MKTLTLVLSFSALVVSQNQFPCDKNDGNLPVKEAFRVKDHIYIMTEQNELWRGDGFRLDPNTKEAKTTGNKKMETSIDASKVKMVFAVRYPEKGDQVLWVLEEQDKSLKQLKGQMQAYGDDGEVKEGSVDINLNIYKYRPRSEPLNLQSLFVKFPDENKFENLMAAANFPLADETTFPPRLFVYYIETPGNGSKSDCTACYQSKRYIFKGEKQGYSYDMNWDVDERAVHKCDDLSGLKVNASLTVDDYNNNGFHLMEIYDDKYRIYRVKMSGKEVDSMEFVSSNFVGAIFGCDQKNKPTDPGPSPIPAPTEPPTTRPTSPTTRVTKAPVTKTPVKTPPTKRPVNPVDPVTPVVPPRRSSTNEPINPTKELSDKNPTDPPPKTNSGMLWFLLLLLLLAVIGGAVLYFFLSQSSPENEETGPPVQPNQQQSVAPMPPPGNADLEAGPPPYAAPPPPPPPQVEPQGPPHSNEQPSYGSNPGSGGASSDPPGEPPESQEPETNL